MPLTDYEQRVIDDLERSLLRDDPKLAKAFNSAPTHSYARIIGVAVGVLLGIALLILGSVMELPLLVAIGFAVMFMSLAWAASSRRAHSRDAEEAQYTYVQMPPKELTTSNTNESNSRFMDRLEIRWNRRQSELG
jgi:Flp pilus assembly protein TadB